MPPRKRANRGKTNKPEQSTTRTVSKRNTKQKKIIEEPIIEIQEESAYEYSSDDIDVLSIDESKAENKEEPMIDDNEKKVASKNKFSTESKSEEPLMQEENVDQPVEKDLPKRGRPKKIVASNKKTNAQGTKMSHVLKRTPSVPRNHSWAVVHYNGTENYYVFPSKYEAMESVRFVPENVRTIECFQTEAAAKLYAQGKVFYVLQWNIGTCIYFENKETLDEAVRFAPRNLYKVKTFKTSEQAKTYISENEDTHVSIGNQDVTVAHFSDTNQTLQTPSPQVNPYAKTSNAGTPISSIGSPTSAYAPNAIFSSLDPENAARAGMGCDLIRKSVNLGSAEFRLTIIRYTGNQPIVDQNSTFVGMSIHDNKDKVYWTFKPVNWAHTFWTNKRTNKTNGEPFLDRIVDNFEYGKMRGTTINHHHYIWSSKKYRQPFPIKSYILFKRFPFNTSDEDIKLAAKLVLEQMNSQIGRQWYRTNFDLDKSPKFETDLNVVQGPYWKVTSILTEKEPVLIHKDSLDSLLTCDDIWKVVSSIFGNIPQNFEEWEASIKEYAFAETMKLTQAPANFYPNMESLETDPIWGTGGSTDGGNYQPQM